MKYKLPLITALILPLTCFARLGETKEQLDARYGKPIKENAGQFTNYTYQKNGYEFWFSMHDGKAEEMSVRNVEGYTLSPSEIEIFLRKNSLNDGFQLFRKSPNEEFYYEAVSNRHAFYEGGRLLIQTQRAIQDHIKFLKSLKTGLEDEEKNNTKDF